MTGRDLKKDDAAKIFEWWRGGCLELMGAMSPGLMNLFAWLLFGAGEDKPAEATPKQRASASKPRASVSKPKPEPKAVADGGTIIPFPPLARLASLMSGIIATPAKAETAVSYPPGSAPDFYQRHLEASDDPKAKIDAGAIKRRYRADCERTGVEPMDPKAFSQALQKFVEYRRLAGGKTYFYGVKWRDVPLLAEMPKGPRVVVDNTLNASSYRFATSS
jgi:hypothetical protein